ncbi:branched-chain amino acid ABC transporter permease [Oceanibacterium hippocampi]|uniref:High-affinity branched-chain amino acid transport system permease protein LivH n=1 Tax=Oceanibacterium hippocampi TaxID=745714 RepID=A0A1Y5TVB1_9PROT|nr:branched-chain amino acid ABC transporter permease [Oceanibacterium hippocampi]SLN74044.1 High-affinity branched-chain amino acid transport system permease protein LivH [Oceanibacterium hippocampi]
MDDLQLIAAALSMGSIYALIGLAFTIIYAASRIMNFAQGELVMLGGLLGVTLVDTNLPYPIAFLVTIATVGAGAGFFGRFMVQPLLERRASMSVIVVLTIATALFLQHGAALVWGKSERFFASPFGGDLVAIGAINFDPQHFVILGTTLLALAATWYFYQRTRIGRSFQAVAINREAASLIGVDPNRATIVAFAVSGSLSAAAGVLFSPLSYATPYMGMSLGLKGIAAAIVGGLGNPTGAVVGGFLIAILELLGATYLSAEYRDAIAFLIMMLVLVIRPAGIAGSAQSFRERYA